MTHRPHPRGTALLALATVFSLAACSGIPGSAAPSDEASSTATSGSAAVGSSASTVVDTSGTVFDASTLHDFSVEVDEAAYAAMIETYVSTGDKEWVTGTVTIDGRAFENVGLKLKGNSSLRGATADTDPVTLPWRIRLDKYVDGQDLDGHTDFVVRANTSETSLNEAVALDLLEAAGLASEHAVSASFTVNGSESELRLVLQNLDDGWDEQNFGDEGILYKADAEGDYSYRGEDPSAYAEAFDIDAGEDDYAPLVEFLDFVNNSTDEEFNAELADHLDVESFARYLAFEDLIGNFDDIAGPGNNSFLRWDAETGVMTVVAWDHNLAFGGMPGGMGGGPGGPGGGQFSGNSEFPRGMTPPEGFEDGQFPEGMTPPEGFEDGQFPEGMVPPGDGEFPEEMTPPEGIEPGQFPGGRGEGMGGGMGGNVLAERFQADEEFTALYDEALADLRAELVDSGVAQEILDGWVELLTTDGASLVDAETVQTEADQIAAVLDGEGSSPRAPQQGSGQDT